MSKQEGRGFTLHGFNWDCYNCCCSVCTGRYCPEHNSRYGWYRYHCAPCVQANGKMLRILDCDFFENKHTSRRHFKIKRKYSREDAIIGRLKKIMEKLDIPDDGVDAPEVRKYNYLDSDTIQFVRNYNKK